MPSENGWGITSEPDDLWLSGDGLTLCYTYHFDGSLKISMDQTSEYTVHEAGTYSYTVDLLTGKASLSILPD